jgi:hypothetical protein
LPDSNLVFYFAGNVDGYLDMSLTGTTYSESNEIWHGNLTNTNKFFGSGIGTVTNLAITKLNGRGSITITQQPSAANGYTAKIQIFNAPASEDYFEFYLTK